MPSKTGNFASESEIATNVSLNELQLAEVGLAHTVSEKSAEVWLKENLNAFACWNKYIEKSGLPLDKYRSF